MGSGTSKEKLGQRILAAQKKLESDTKMQTGRYEQINASSQETLDVLVRSIGDSFARCSPFSEPTLLVAFKANPEEVQRIVTKSCKKVLSAPIQKNEYEWFKVQSSFEAHNAVWRMCVEDMCCPPGTSAAYIYHPLSLPIVRNVSA